MKAFFKKTAIYNTIELNLVSFLLTLYFAKSSFHMLKYFFVVMGLLSIILITRHVLSVRPLLSQMIIPGILLLFYLVGILTSEVKDVYVLKELINGIITLYLCLLLFIPKRDQTQKILHAFFVQYAYLFAIIGSMALFRFCFQILKIPIPLADFLFPTFGLNISLVSDFNFYALNFLIAFLITFNLNKKGILNRKISITFFIVYLINVLLAFSRRGYVAALLLLLLFIVLVIMEMVKNKKPKYLVNVPIAITITIFSMALMVYIFRYDLYMIDQKYNGITKILHRVNIIFNEDESMESLNKRIWKNTESSYWEKYDSKDGIDLLYNGDFAHDLKFWTDRVPPKDSLQKKIVDDNANKFVRISRPHGKGYYQLLYNGRHIQYHAGVTYTVKLKYRIVQGSKDSFSVGWWINEGNGYINNMKINFIDTIDSWQIGTFSYRFLDDHSNLHFGINSQVAGTIIEIDEIHMFSDDSLNRAKYSYQMYNNSAASEPNVNMSFANDRWEHFKYAYHLWKTEYSWINKVLGKGFDYLPLFGRQFYNNPQRYDYPHNPIISSFLYSGWLGGLFYLFFLVMGIYNYFSLRKEFSTLLFIFLLVLFFCMFSGNSHFSIPIFIFLSFVPFYIKKIK